jgi:hypothetical protein
MLYIKNIMNIREPRLGLIPEVHREVMHACMHTHDLQQTGAGG